MGRAGDAKLVSKTGVGDEHVVEDIGRVTDVRDREWTEFLESRGGAVVGRGNTTLLEQVRVFMERQKVGEDLGGMPKRRERVENGYW